MIGRRLRLAVLQFAPTPGDAAGNADRIRAAAEAADADLAVAPELALTGYGLGDTAREHAVALEPADRDRRPLPPGLAGVADLVLGVPELGTDGVVYNAAVHLRAGEPLARHRKVYLPTYGMFDEARFFGRGGTARAYDMGGGWRAGLLVCEDLWHPALSYLLCVQGAHAIFVLAAAPGRGVWDGGADGGRFSSADAWKDIARATARAYGVYVVLANRVGAEFGLCFAGGSLVVGPDGRTLARATDDAPETLVADLDLAEVDRARQPYAHARDDDPWLTLRELTRVLAVATDAG